MQSTSVNGLKLKVLEVAGAKALATDHRGCSCCRDFVQPAFAFVNREVIVPLIVVACKIIFCITQKFKVI